MAFGETDRDGDYYTSYLNEKATEEAGQREDGSSLLDKEKVLALTEKQQLEIHLADIEAKIAQEKYDQQLGIIGSERRLKRLKIMKKTVETKLNNLE